MYHKNQFNYLISMIQIYERTERQNRKPNNHNTVFEKSNNYKKSSYFV